MLYSILKILFRITFRFFFRTVKQHHPERVPLEGPLIICANHPGAFLDPVIIAALIKRRVFFLAKAAVFKGKFAQWLLPRLNMIPVYRAQDDPSQMHKNRETFERCYNHLEKKGAMMIFPEGVSITERKLRPLKTGAARIALGAEERNNFQLGVNIICIGVNYENPHAFRKNVFLSYSEPIAVAAYTDRYQKEGFAAAEALTEEIRLRLETQMIHVADEETDRLVKAIEKLYGHQLLKEEGLKRGDGETNFEITQRILTRVNFFRSLDPELVKKTSAEISSYFAKVEELGLSDRVVRSTKNKGSRFLKNLNELFFILWGFPVFVYGLLHNYLPFAGASLLSRKLAKDIEFRGAIGAAAGMFLYLLWYTALGIAGWHFIPHWYLFTAWLLSWIPSGLFAWYYFTTVRTISKRWLLMSLFFRDATLIAELVAQRKRLVEEFEKARGKDIPQHL